MKNPKEIVGEGYDKVSFAYRKDHPDESGDAYRQYRAWIDDIGNRILADASVLDLGCGCGVPATQLLARRFNVVGVDISPVQIARARRLVPEASFICGDMCRMRFPSEAFEAVICLYALIHVPVEEQPTLLGKVWEWIRPGGYFLLITGHREWTGHEVHWLGVEGATMYWSQVDRDTSLRWLENAGFSILWDRFIPEGDGGHCLMLVQKAKPGAVMKSS